MKVFYIFKIGIIKPIDQHNKVIPLCKSAR